MEKVIRRGYVKWTDEDGVQHKEPLFDHPDMLANATPEEQIQAEELRRLIAEGERQMAEYEEDNRNDAEATLAALKAADEDVLTSAQLDDTAPASGAEEPARDDSNNGNNDTVAG